MSGIIVSLSKTLRRHPTDAEQMLWKHLRMKQMEGLKFRRQHPIGQYIVDFICLEKQIIIEVDGGQHAVAGNTDAKRDANLKQCGFKVLRFWNNEVLQKTRSVLEVIREECLSPPGFPPP